MFSELSLLSYKDNKNFLQSLNKDFDNAIKDISVNRVFDDGHIEDILHQYPLKETLAFKDHKNVIIINIDNNNYQRFDDEFFKGSRMCIDKSVYTKLMDDLDDQFSTIIGNKASLMVLSDITTPNKVNDIINSKSEDERKTINNRIDKIKELLISSYRQRKAVEPKDILYKTEAIYEFIITRDSIHEFLLNPEQPAHKLYKKQPPTDPILSNKLAMFTIKYNTVIYPIIYNPRDNTLYIATMYADETSYVTKLIPLIETIFDKRTVVISTQIKKSSGFDNLTNLTNKPLSSGVFYFSRVLLGLLKVSRDNYKKDPANSNHFNLMLLTPLFSEIKKHLRQNNEYALLELIVTVGFNSLNFNKHLNYYIIFNEYKMTNKDRFMLTLNTRAMLSNIFNNAIREEDKLNARIVTV